jgi:hypothetical protein
MVEVKGHPSLGLPLFWRDGRGWLCPTRIGKRGLNLSSLNKLKTPRANPNSLLRTLRGVAVAESTTLKAQYKRFFQDKRYL